MLILIIRASSLEFRKIKILMRSFVIHFTENRLLQRENIFSLK